MRVHLKVSCIIGSDVTSNDKVKEAVAAELRICTLYVSGGNKETRSLR